MTVQGKRLRRRPGRQDVAPARFFEICHPHIWGCGIDIYASFRAFKAAETSTDLNRCQHISTHVNTSQHRQGDPHIWDLHFCQEGGGAGRLSLFQNQLTKNGSDHAISGPLFIFTSRFDLFTPHPLTLLLIGGRFVSGISYEFFIRLLIHDFAQFVIFHFFLVGLPFVIISL